VCAESKGVQHLEVFEGLPQGVRAGVFFKTQSWRKLRKDKTFETIEGSTGSCAVDRKRHCKLRRRQLSIVENHLVKSCRSPCEGKRRTVGILCGEFTKSRESSDLTEEQGSYGEYSQRFKLRRGRTVDSSQQGSLDLHMNF
jgi:hypothetical protein